MQASAFHDAVAAVSKDDNRYHPEAYLFLRDALDATIKRRKKLKKDVSAHVSAGELLEGFRVHAINEFGPMAITVFDHWGVRSCDDVGHMVFNLVNAGVFGKTEEDTIESFSGVFDFRSAFVAPFKSGNFSLNSGVPGNVRGGK